MAAVNHVSSYVLGQRFERLHGMSVDHALSGHWLMPGTRTIHPPEEYDEAHDVMRRGVQPWHEVVSEQVEKVNAPRDLLRSWARNHDEILVGGHLAAATRVRDLTSLMNTQAVPNETTIYRGAVRSPQELKELDPTFPQSFTTDRFVAQSFAKKSYTGTRGQIFKMAPGHARGLALEDFDANIRTVGQSSRRENEFLVDPRAL